MRPPRRTFHNSVLPPVSIVEDRSETHKLTNDSIGNFGSERKGGERCPVCYHEGVLKQTAVRHGREFMKHVVPAVVKPARVLWNEIIGFVFISFGVIFGFKTFSYARDFSRTSSAGGDATGDLVRLGMAGFCTLLMAYFGVTSFRRARKISRT